MTYTRVELCHISDLVHHLRTLGYKDEDYPSKKTCIEELKRRGVFQIDVQPVRAHLARKQQNASTARSLLSNPMTQPREADDSLYVNPVFNRQLVFDQSSTQIIQQSETTTPNSNKTYSERAHTYDASYQYLTVTNELHIRNKLVLDDKDVTQLVTDVNDSYSSLQKMLNELNARIRELDDKTSDLASMRLPMYNVSKTISYEDIKDNLSNATYGNVAIFDTIEYVNFDGKLLDTTAYVHISFEGSLKKRPDISDISGVNSSKLVELRIPIPINISPDPNPTRLVDETNALIDVFLHYPVLHNIVNIQQRNNGEQNLTTILSGNQSRASYIDTTANEIVLQFSYTSALKQYPSIFVSLQMSYFVKVPTVDSGGSVNFKAEINGPVRYSTLYSTIQTNTFTFEYDRTTYVWTVFDEQIDLFINLRKVSQTELKSILETDGLLLPFRSANEPTIDKIGNSYITYIDQSNSDQPKNVRDNVVFIIRKNDPNRIYMLPGSSNILRTTQLYDANMTIHVSYFRDITDTVDTLRFVDGVNHGFEYGNVVYFKAEDPYTVNFFTTESINQYYLKNKLQLVFDSPSDADDLPYYTSIQGVQTLWEVNVHGNIQTIDKSWGFIRGEIELFGQKYVTSNSMHVINSVITMDVTTKSNVNSIDLYLNNIDNARVFDLPYELVVELTNHRNNSTTTTRFDSANINTSFSHTFHPLIYNTSYRMNVYTKDKLGRTTPLYDADVVTTLDGAFNKPQLLDVFVSETNTGFDFLLNAYYYESTIEDNMQSIDMYYIITTSPEHVLGNLSSTITNNGNRIVTNSKISQQIGSIKISEDLLTIDTFYVTLITIPSAQQYKNINYVSYVTTEVVVQSVLDSNIRNATYNATDDVYYTRSIGNVYYDIDLSVPFETVANLGTTYTTTFSGNIVQFTGPDLYTEPLSMSVELLLRGSYSSGQILVVDPNVIQPGVVEFGNVDYQYYSLFVGNVFTESHMKYTVSIAFDNYLDNVMELDSNASFANVSEIMYDNLHIPEFPPDTLISGNVILTDRLNDSFVYPFQLQTTRVPDLEIGWVQQHSNVLITANIVEHTDFATWNGNVNWYVDGNIMENVGTGRSAIFNLPIPMFENPVRFKIKANVDHNPIELFGNVEANVYGVRGGEQGLTFDKLYYNIQNDPITIHFQLLQPHEASHSHFATLFHKETNSKITNTLTFGENIIVGNIEAHVTFPDVKSDISTIGYIYARIESKFVDSSIEIITNTESTSILDRNPVVNIHSFVVLNQDGTYRLMIDNLEDDTAIPHDIQVFTNNDEGGWTSVANVFNVTTYDQFPFEVTSGLSSSSFDPNHDIIKYYVTDHLRGVLTPTHFYFPTTFQHRLYGISIGYDKYDQLEETYTSNIQGYLLSRDDFSGNVVIDYTMTNMSNTNHTIIGNVESNYTHFVIRELFYPDETYQIRLYIESQFDQEIGSLYATIPELVLIAKTSVVNLSSTLSPTGNVVVLPQFGVELSSMDSLENHRIEFVNCSIECDSNITIGKNSNTEYLRNTLFRNSENNNKNVHNIVLSNVSDTYGNDVRSIYPFHVYVKQEALGSIQMKVHSMSVRNESDSSVWNITTQDVTDHFDIGFHYAKDTSNIVNTVHIFSNGSSSLDSLPTSSNT